MSVDDISLFSVSFGDTEKDHIRHFVGHEDVEVKNTVWSSSIKVIFRSLQSTVPVPTHRHPFEDVLQKCRIPKDETNTPDTFLTLNSNFSFKWTICNLTREIGRCLHSSTTLSLFFLILSFR